MISAWFLLPVVPIIALAFFWGHWIGSEPTSYAPGAPLVMVRRPEGFVRGDEDDLRVYLKERRRGVVHTKETARRMKRMRKAYDRRLVEVLGIGHEGPDYITWGRH